MADSLKKDTGELARGMVREMDAFEALAEALGISKDEIPTDQAGRMKMIKDAAEELQQLKICAMISDQLIATAAKSLVTWIGLDAIGITSSSDFPGLRAVMETPGEDEND